MYFRKIIVLLLVLIVSMGTVIYIHAESSDTTDAETVITNTSPLVPETMEAFSNRQVHPFQSEEVLSEFGLEGFDKVAESAKAELWLNSEWNTIRIRNKESGYLWGALPLEKAEGLNKSWNNYGNSIAAIECFDEAGTEKRYNMTQDAENTYSMTENGFSCHSNYPELGIAFDVEVSLVDNRLSFFVDEDSILEGKDGGSFNLKSIIFMPYLGAVYSDSLDGYILIPDGSGALLRFRKPAQYIKAYDARVYGKDLGIEVLSAPADLNARRPNDYIIEEPQVLMPVYGMVHGAYQNGLFAVIESGAEFASIAATPAMQNNPYNWVGARFELRQKYNKNINRQEGAGAIVPQELRNPVSPGLSIYILDGKEANYDGMAALYRNLLISSGKLPKMDKADNSIPLRLEVLGAGLHNEFIGKSLRLFTSTAEAGDIVNELAGDGITDISLIYRSYTKNNIAGGALLSEVGNKESFTELADQLGGTGGRLYFYLNLLSANEDQINLRTQAANNLSKMVIRLTRSNIGVMYPDTYFYRLSTAEGLMNRILENSYIDKARYAIDELSYRLYGDFTSKKEADRLENLNKTLEMIEKAAAHGTLPMYSPNEYLWKYTSEFYDTPLVSGQFLYETDTVPFLEIVLKGSIPMFGTPLNTGTYSPERLLRHIEYGVEPSFVVAGCESIDLFDTTEEDYFSTNFGDWKSYILTTYQMLTDALKGVEGQTITEHIALEDGFIRVTYANGVKIYVNYTGSAKWDGDIKVEPKWYYVHQ